MGKPLYDKLSKQDLSRHFPNISHGGKGSHARKFSASSKSKFDDNWDRIFGKKESPQEDTDNGTDSSSKE